MEFLVTRSSHWEEKPCEEAVTKELVYVDRRTVKTLAEAKGKQWADHFFASGTNHREEIGMVARDKEPRKEWVVNFDTLEALLKFSDKYGDIIISSGSNYKGIKYEVEMKDDYRE